MVVSIEPPVFLAEERIGAHIINHVLVTETGAELLSGRNARPDRRRLDDGYHCAQPMKG
jgi:Xaa-Pro aminopeptidase